MRFRKTVSAWIIVYLFVAAIFLCSNCMAAKVVGFLMPQSGLGDQSFNDMTYAGMVKARNEFKFALIREKTTDNTENSRKAGLEVLLNRGATVVVANGWEFRNIIRKAAKKNPHVKFVLNDFAVTAGDNLVSTVYGQHEGAFLAGALSAWKTHTGKIGFIGGENMPIIRAFFKGFEEGAFYANKKIEIISEYIGGSDDHRSGFDNPGFAYLKAKEMYLADADIIFTVAGLSGNGVIQAALERKRFVIGVDADQDHMAKGYILTSVMKRLDIATYRELATIMKGEFEPGVHFYGLKEKGVALSPMTYTRELIGSDIINRLKDLEEKIISGQIVVTNILSREP